MSTTKTLTKAAGNAAAMGNAMRSLLPETSVRNLLAGGAAVLAVGMGGMTAWAALAPLHSAVVAQGALAPETGRKTVRHSEGGQIGEILVRGGDTVRAGQVLMRLDATEAETRLEVLNAQWLEMLALEARLQAELFDREAIEWPAELQKRRAGSATVTKLMDNQKTLFDVRRHQLTTEERLIGERVETLREEGASLEQQRTYQTREMKLVQEDIRITQGLLDRGNSTRTKLVELQREEARLMARDKDIEARIAQTKQQAAEAQGDWVKRRNDFREKVLIDLDKARSETARLAEQIRDAANRLANRDIKAPDDGIVVMNGHPAVGGTIVQNEAILDVVPDGRALLAEVHVQPKDIKSITVDLPVKVQLTAYDSRVVGSLDGTVEYVSADRIVDPVSRQDYYLARIRLKDENPEAHEVHKLTIKPGMPVEARILLSARTPLDYLVTPLSQSYIKAFVQE
ncbi:HlyD family type I secretion periplasmic adaptor subunit [Azospirillum sp.]|uniref:HlyD family type I secretion periplasmic adaptor subunit n=1 Tax=Azospirillum sp. TaxID=34012 RepID=UPI002D464B7A|nr:HlyD family type I secretion periplasmic adaptor subunit [Azospirillum sp.]HYD64702.1 HlyD family type I secretion periplasmic adaptor subunit [Azospirillum sp.]